MKITISEAPSHYFNDDTCEDFIKRQFKVGSIDGLGIDEQEDMRCQRAHFSSIYMRHRRTHWIISTG